MCNEYFLRRTYIQSTQSLSKFYYNFPVTRFAKIAFGKLKPASIRYFIPAEISRTMHAYISQFFNRAGAHLESTNILLERRRIFLR